MIVAGILFVFGIIAGIQILYILFSSWFWRFLAYTTPLACVLLIVVFGKNLNRTGDLWIVLLITAILSIPMIILETKKEKEISSSNESQKKIKHLRVLFLRPNPRVPVPTFPRVFEFPFEDHNSPHNTATK